MVKVPCQTIVWDVLPAIRAAIAVELVQCGVAQNEAARLLGLTTSAVSQYITGKRGYRIEFEDDVRDMIRRLAEDLRDGRVPDPIPRICEICRQLRSGDGGCCGKESGNGGPGE